jgi:asparagine synthase (glutamine-hydrolysing)
MCGISGMFGRPDRTTIARMAQAMVHRGPDDDGYYVDDQVALGFRRLSIIDVAGGQQPLTNEDRSLLLVFNGEIYNHPGLRRRLEARGHHFRTRSDGEVILHLYEEEGTAFIDSLNGIFAFGLWDRLRQRLLLARDHHGVKPLYWSDRAESFLFASELKSLIASGLISRAIDGEAVAQYLAYQVVPPPLSILRDVRMLPPGHLLIKTSDEVRIRSYWAPPHDVPHQVTSVDEAKSIALDGLRDAVKRQMMSERPLGVFLSGGVDSSALVALAAEQVSHPLKTFSVGFVGADESVLTEWPWARKVAERYGTDHQEVVLTESMFRDALPHTFSAMDQPTSDGINSYWVSQAAARHVTVALSGTGGDELFLGYERDRRLLDIAGMAAPLQHLPAGYVRRVVDLLDRIPEAGLWRRVEQRKQAARAFARLDDEFTSPRTIGIFDADERAAVIAPSLRSDGAGFERPSAYLRRDVRPNLANPGEWIASLEQRGYLSYVLLRDIDAMSMAHSLEVRVPFLDPRYTEAVARIPSSMKIRGGVGKWVLKEALRPLLPDDVLFRTKMGFGLPYNVWMRRTLEPMVRDLLSPTRIARRGVFDSAAAAGLLTRFYDGDDGVWRKVWTLFVLEGWAAEVLDATPEACHVAA